MHTNTQCQFLCGFVYILHGLRVCTCQQVRVRSIYQQHLRIARHYVPLLISCQRPIHVGVLFLSCNCQVVRAFLICYFPCDRHCTVMTRHGGVMTQASLWQPHDHWRCDITGRVREMGLVLSSLDRDAAPVPSHTDRLYFHGETQKHHPLTLVWASVLYTGRFIHVVGFHSFIRVCIRVCTRASR